MIVRLRRIGPEIHGKLRFHAKEFAPFHPPIIREPGIIEQPVDQAGSFIRIVVTDETGRLLGRGQRPDDIQINPADEYRIGTDIRRSNSQRRQLAEHKAVDLSVGSHRILLTFKR